MLKLRFTAKLMLGYGVPIVFTLIATVIVFSTLSANTEAAALVSHTNEVISNAEALLLAAVDAETGQRGFIITGQEEFLEPFTAGVANFTIAAANLKTLVSDNPPQVARVEQMEQLFSQWQEQAGEPEIEKAREVHAAEASLANLGDILGQGLGKSILDNLRAELDDLEARLTQDEDWESVTLVIKIAKDMVDQETGQRGFIITGEEDFLEPFRAGGIALAVDIAALRPRLSQASMRSILSNVETLAADWLSQAAEPEIAARRANDATPGKLSDVAALLTSGTGKGFLDEIRTINEEFIAIEQGLLVERAAANELTTSTGQTATLIGPAVTIIASLIVAVVLARTLGGSLNSIKHVVQGLSAGNLTLRSDVSSGDEIGELGAAFNQMADDLQKTLNGLEQRTRIIEGSAQVSRGLSTIHDPTKVFSEVVDQVRSAGDYYHVEIYELDQSDRTLKLVGGTGEVGRIMIAAAHSTAVGQGLIGRVAHTNSPVLVRDVSQVPGWQPNAMLPDTKSEVAVPISIGEQIFGVLDVQHDVPGGMGQEDVDVLNSIANQIAFALQNARVFVEAEQTRSELEERAKQVIRGGWQEYFNAIERGERLGYAYESNALAQITSPDAQTVNENALIMPIEVIGEKIGAITLEYDAEQNWDDDSEFVSVVAQQVAQRIENVRLLVQADEQRAEAEQATRRLTREGWETHRTDSNGADAFVYDGNQVSPLTTAIENTDHAVSQPLTIRDETIGRLVLPGYENADKDTTELLRAVGERLSTHIENLRLFEETERGRQQLDRRAGQLETVAQVGAVTSTILDTEQLLQEVVDLTKSRFGLYHAHIYLVDEAENALKLAAGAGEIGRQMVAEGGSSIPLSRKKSLVARAAREQKGVIVNDVSKDTSFLPNPLLPKTRSEMAVPLIVGTRVLGVLDVQSYEVDYFGDEDIHIQTTLAAQVAVALQNATLYAEQTATVERLAELGQLKSSFLANMSHELRTPLNSILGFVDVMLEGLDGPLTEPMETDLNVITKNGQHLLHLINDVLDMAKIESGTMNMNIERFNIAKVLEEVMVIAGSLAREKSLELRLDLESSDDLELEADPARLQQIILNLVGNAVKFTDEGVVTIDAQRENGDILVNVRDTGIGIKPHEIEEVFEEFRQADISTTRKAGGTGLGLPISKKLVELHGGEIWVESTGIPGEGSVFSVRMPVKSKVKTEEHSNTDDGEDKS